MTRVITYPPPPPGARIVLCVEDITTQVYLSECWGLDPDFALVPVYGNENVRTVVQRAQLDGAPNVFGFRDRDFGPTNRATWADPAAGRVLRSGAHELENYLLDEGALASCYLNTAARAEADVANRMYGVAARLPWWMACRLVLTEIRAELIRQYPEHPPYEQVVDHATAVAYVATHPWYLDLPNRSAATTGAAALPTRLAAAYGSYGPMPANGRWKHGYSGKEIFRNLRDWIYPNPGPRGEARRRIGQGRRAAPTATEAGAAGGDRSTLGTPRAGGNLRAKVARGGGDLAALTTPRPAARCGSTPPRNGVAIHVTSLLMLSAPMPPPPGPALRNFSRRV